MPNARTPGAKRATDGEHLFDLRSVNRVMGGPDYSPVFGGCVEGERMIVALMRYPAGQPSEPHSHPNEQWIYVLEGVMELIVDGERHTAQPGEVIYIPANTVHSGSTPTQPSPTCCVSVIAVTFVSVKPAGLRSTTLPALPDQRSACV